MAATEITSTVLRRKLRDQRVDPANSSLLSISKYHSSNLWLLESSDSVVQRTDMPEARPQLHRIRRTVCCLKNDILRNLGPKSTPCHIPLAGGRGCSNKLEEHSQPSVPTDAGPMFFLAFSSSCHFLPKERTVCAAYFLCFRDRLSFPSSVFVLELLHSPASLCTAEWWPFCDADLARLLFTDPETPASVGDGTRATAPQLVCTAP